MPKFSSKWPSLWWMDISVEVSQVGGWWPWVAPASGVGGRRRRSLCSLGFYPDILTPVHNGSWLAFGVLLLYRRRLGFYPKRCASLVLAPSLFRTPLNGRE
uniref:Uncharacterized protein n=1 Tax=Cannabis sativa TaxID=3483 RepID=A0A803PJG8_CANSA